MDPLAILSLISNLFTANAQLSAENEELRKQIADLTSAGE